MATGKISRLPREIREQLGQRLDDGEPGNRLVAWLNELPAVRALLVAQFGGTAINEQNLTNWKQGGFRDWRMDREARALMPGRANSEEEAEQQLRPTMEQAPVVTPEQLSTLLAVRYLAAFREWQQSTMPVDRRWRQLRVMLRDVSKLRRGEQRAERLALAGERREVQESLATPPTAGARTEVNPTESGLIKVNQGEKF